MSDIKTKNIGDLDIITELTDTDYVLVESEGEMKRINGGSITPSQEENVWEPRIMIPDGFIATSYTQIFTPSEAATLAGSGGYPVYYLPEEIDFDTLSSLEITATFLTASSSLLVHKTATSFSNTSQILWMPNCRCINIAGGAFSIVKASDCATYPNLESYEFPNNVKTIIIMSSPYKPNVETGMLSGASFLQLVSIKWTKTS